MSASHRSPCRTSSSAAPIRRRARGRVVSQADGRVTGAIAAALEPLERRVCMSVSFSGPVSWPTGGGASSVVVSDFNGDGKQDLATANFAADNVSILIGNGSGAFSAPTNFAVGPQPLSVAVGDFNGDGKQD